jgi:phosphoribosylanthranilate isomerase
MRIKVCGMTRLDQVRQLDALGVEFAGFIFYAPSPRFVGRHGLEPQQLRREKLGINRVGVFVNAPAEEVLQTVDEWRLHMVQLHGDESPKYCEHISNHVTTIKAFRMGADENLQWKIHPYRDVCDMFLFDAVGVSYGGNGTQFNWSQLTSKEIRKPFFLSGGIGLDDAGRVQEFAARESGFFAVDVNSKFETSPGVKDLQLLETFCDQLRGPAHDAHSAGQA